MLRDLVLPRVLEHFVDILEWIETCLLYVKVLSLCKKLNKYCSNNRYNRNAHSHVQYIVLQQFHSVHH